MTSKVIAITGATGFIGKNLLKILPSHYVIKALVRPQSYHKGLSSKVKWVLGNLEDPEALESLLEGAEVVVHLAGAIKGRDYLDFARVNIRGFKNLLTKSLEAGVSRFLYISTLAAREPYLSPYASTKRWAEELLAHTPLKWNIFRPPAVYGPFDEELTPLIKLTLKGILPVFGELENRFSLLYVEDLCYAILKWIKLEAPPSKIYELHDGKTSGYSWAEVQEIVAKIRGKPPKILKIPKSTLKPISFGVLWGGKIFKIKPMLTPYKINELYHPDWTCDNAEISKDLGWQPLWPLEKVLRDWAQNGTRRDFKNT